MAVNVNTVYTTVLYILNKEQRGYVTPAEFNSIGTLVQQEIFNSYFPDGGQLNRQVQNNTENDTDYFNMFRDLEYKLFPFKKQLQFVYSNGFFYNNTGEQLYRIGEVVVKYLGQPQFNSVAQLVTKKDFEKITRSKLTSPTKQYPLYYTTNFQPANSTEFVLGLKIYPELDSSSGLHQSQIMTVMADVIVNPAAILWNYDVGTVGQYQFQTLGSTNFQLDISEQNNLIIRILKYFGVVINDPTIIEVATSEAEATEVNLKS